MKTPKLKLPSWGKPLIIFIVITILILSGGISFYNYQKQILKDQIKSEFSRIANNTTNEVSAWLTERRDDAEFAFENRQISEDIYKLVNSPLNISYKQTISNWLQPINTFHDYYNIFIINYEGKVVFSLLDSANNINVPHIISPASNKNGDNGVYSSDIQIDSVTKKIYIDYNVPLVLRNDKNIIHFGLLVFRINPYKSFYKIIKSMPIPFKSAEAYLVRRDGNFVTYLSEQHYRQKAPFNYKVPITEIDRPSVQAALGREGFFEGKDYRGVKVLSFIKNIPGTSWYLISKVDQDVIYSHIFYLSLVIFLLIAFLIIISLIANIWIWQVIKNKTKRAELESRMKHLALVKHYDYLIKYSNDNFFLLDTDLRIVNVNDTALKTYGYTKEEFSYLTLQDIRPKETWSSIKPLVNQIEMQTELIFETTHIKKNGKIFPVEVSTRIINIEGQNFYQSVVRDITERKNYEINLQRMNRIYSVLSNINQLIVRTSDRKKIYDEVCRISVENGKFVFAVIGILDADRDKVNMVSSYGFDNGYSLKMKISLSDPAYGSGPVGTSIKEHKYIICNDIENDKIMIPWRQLALANGYRSNASFPLILNNNAVGFIGFYSNEINFFTDEEVKLLEELSSDISFALEFLDNEEKRKSYEIALQQSEEKFSKAFLNSPDGISITRLEDGKIAEVNQKFLDELCFEREDVIGKTTIELNCWAEPQERKIYANLIRENGSVSNYETRWKKADGEIIFLLINANIITLNNEPYIIAISQNITDIIITRQKLIEAKEKAEDMNKLKSAFLANMSHELRTPMIGILGYTDILQREIKTQTHKKMLGSINASATRLLNTLNLVLDLSRIESNRQELNDQIVNIPLQVMQVVSTFFGYAKNKNLHLETVIHDENITANIDERVFDQIMDNLINNALKYTDTGSVIIEVGSEQIDNKAWATIKVKDTGIGIPAESLDLIFEEFRQVSEGYGRHYEGTGLGLAITKKSIEVMGGSISVESKLGTGSTFIVRFPLYNYAVDSYEKDEQRILDDTNIPVEAEIKNKNRILIVDNDDVTRDFISLVLKKNYIIDSAESGPEAIKLAEQNHYSIILMDIGLGFGMNGIDAAREIKKIPGYENVPIVALTAYAMKGDKENFLSQGLTHYISKPFLTKDLINLLNEILKKH